jgi:hypothetical protein
MSLDLAKRAADLRAMNARLDEEKRELEQRAREAVRLQEAKLADFDAARFEPSIDDRSSEPARASGGLPAARRAAAAKKARAAAATGAAVDSGAEVTPDAISSPRILRGARASAFRRGRDAPARGAPGAARTTAGTRPATGPGAGIGVAELDEAGVGDELAPEAQVRLQKVRLRSLQTELEAAKKQLRGRSEKLREAAAGRKAAEEATSKLRRQLAAQTKKLRAGEAAAAKAAGRISALEGQVARLRQDLRTEQKNVKAEQRDGGSKDVRLNRALEELARLKEQLRSGKQRQGEQSTEGQQRIRAQEKEIRLLERQRTELLAAFKKQAKLINVLKQQKMHIEAAKLLSFTEEEFMRTLDSGGAGS